MHNGGLLPIVIWLALKLFRASRGLKNGGLHTLLFINVASG